MREDPKRLGMDGKYHKITLFVYDMPITNNMLCENWKQNKSAANKIGKKINVLAFFSSFQHNVRGLR